MLAVLQRISGLATWLAGAALVLCALGIAVEVVARKAFNVSLGGVDEITSYVFAIGVAWSFAFTLFGRAHIRIDILYNRLPPRGRSLLDLLALAALLVAGGILFWQAGATALTSFELGARSNTPLGIILWKPQFLWIAGLGFFLLCVVALTFVSLRALLRGDDREVSRIAGIRTLEEEIRDER